MHHAFQPSAVVPSGFTVEGAIFDRAAGQGNFAAIACREAGVSEQSIRDELINGEIFYSLKEAQVVIAQWRTHYNRIRPHSSLGYRRPTP